MLWYIVMQLFSTLLEWVRIGRLSEREKDLEILILRQQLMIVEQQMEKPVRRSRIEPLDPDRDQREVEGGFRTLPVWCEN